MKIIEQLAANRRTPNGDRVLGWTRYPVAKPPTRGYHQGGDLLPTETGIETHYLVRTDHSLDVYNDKGERLTRLNERVLREVL